VRIRLLDVELDALTVSDLNQLVSEAVTSETCRVIANHNLHSIYLFHVDTQMQKFYHTAYKIHIDGMPLIYLARIFGYPVAREHRVTYLDWIWALMFESELQSWRVFYLGGKPGVAARAAELLRQRYPGLHLETHHGYFNRIGPENDQLLERIRCFKPNILLVGMGMPLQEHWILENLDAVECNVILTAGACFDYIAGAIPLPPRWMGRLGLEWLFRLASEPGRLWKRYLVEPWYIFGLVLKKVLHQSSR
jgi:N-acetylglucosaminyldiphosphoundecaprenol N-acetyl-beta-D-mannosaminyltransferase